MRSCQDTAIPTTFPTLMLAPACFPAHLDLPESLRRVWVAPDAPSAQHFALLHEVMVGRCALPFAVSLTGRRWLELRGREDGGGWDVILLMCGERERCEGGSSRRQVGRAERGGRRHSRSAGSGRMHRHTDGRRQSSVTVAQDVSSHCGRYPRLTG